jgi:molybdopterin-guanine dinucleotide biosynthesis protein A
MMYWPIRVHDACFPETCSTRRGHSRRRPRYPSGRRQQGRADLFTDAGVPVVDDVIAGAGALGGIHAAIAQSPAERTIVVACDMPFLSVELLQRLARPTNADVVIPRSARGYEPLCAAWSAACEAPIRRRIERGALKAALALEDLRVEEIGPDALASCDPHGLLFVNVNTAHDYERAQELSGLESDG